MAVFNKPLGSTEISSAARTARDEPRRFGHEISKPKLRPGGADTTPDCQKAQTGCRGISDLFLGQSASQHHSLEHTHCR